ncbi:MAG: hypothetical protein GF411_03330 [Candidatus Lokiarchaeota archaeon]|nr:hypothetical protein [Candidatus Lokiarchaeota archaeon]
MSFEEDHESWEEDTTSPDTDDSISVTEDNIEQTTDGEEPRIIATDAEKEHKQKRIPSIKDNEEPETEEQFQKGYMGLILNLLMLSTSVAIVYVYFMQDVNSDIRTTFAILMGIVVGFLILITIGYVIIKPFLKKKEDEKIGDEYRSSVDSGKGIIDIEINQPFVQYRATALTIKVRNISNSEGIRIRFHSMDHVSPSSVDLALAAGEEDTIMVQLVPIAIGDREISIEFANLFDENGNLIPKFEADTQSVEKFRYVSREPALGGITASQVRFMKTIVSVATALVLGSSFIVAFFGEFLGGFEQIIKTYMPMLVIFQVPVFYVYFALMNRLPS